MRRMDTGRRAFWLLMIADGGAVAAVAVAACCLPVVYVAGVHDPAALAPAVVLSGIALAGLGLGAHAGVTVARATRQLRHDLVSRAVPASARLQAAAKEAGLGGRVDAVNDRRPYAVTYGVVAPRVAISNGLLAALTDAELAAVLAHESVHVRRRDPLKAALTAVSPARRVLLPALRALRSRFVVGIELAADRWAIRQCGRRALAGALLKTVEAMEPTPAGAAALAEPGALDARLTQLESGQEGDLPRPTARAVTVSAAGAAAMAWAVAGSTALIRLYCGC